MTATSQRNKKKLNGQSIAAINTPGRVNQACLPPVLLSDIMANQCRMLFRLIRYIPIANHTTRTLMMTIADFTIQNLDNELYNKKSVLLFNVSVIYDFKLCDIAVITNSNQSIISASL